MTNDELAVLLESVAQAEVKRNGATVVGAPYELPMVEVARQDLFTVVRLSGGNNAVVSYGISKRNPIDKPSVRGVRLAATRAAKFYLYAIGYLAKPTTLVLNLPVTAV